MNRTLIVFAMFAMATVQSSTPAAFGKQAPVQGRLQESLVVFELTEVKEPNHQTKSQVSIVFANRTFDTKDPPPLLMGDDIVAEFSFSGLDVPKDVMKPFRFSRRVKDTSFLDARYIRVVNQDQNDGWSGDTLSIFVDGAHVVKTSLFPRKQPGGRIGMTNNGLQACTRDSWFGCIYWEEEMAKFRYGAKK